MQALDSGGALTKDAFEHSKFAVKKVSKMIKQLTANKITGNVCGSRSGIIQFASLVNTEIKIHLSDYDNKHDLNQAIKHDLEYTGGGTAIAKALELAGEEFDDNSFDCRNRRVMLITDGYETQGGDPQQEADELKNDGAEICVVTIGKFQKMTLLEKVATEYNQKPCICGTETWKKLDKGMTKLLKLLQPVFDQRRKLRKMKY